MQSVAFLLFGQSAGLISPGPTKEKPLVFLTPGACFIFCFQYAPLLGQQKTSVFKIYCLQQKYLDFLVIVYDRLLNSENYAGAVVKINKFRFFEYQLK
jgi:hypothetical protein